MPSDPVIISLVSLFGTLCTLGATIFISINVKKVEVATNSMKDALVAATRADALKEGHAAGIVDEKTRSTMKAGIVADAVAVGRAAAVAEADVLTRARSEGAQEKRGQAAQREPLKTDHVQIDAENVSVEQAKGKK